MRKLKIIFISCLLVLTILFTSSIVAFAEDHSYAESEQVISPISGTTFYIGDQIPYSIEFWNNSGRYYSKYIELGCGSGILWTTTVNRSIAYGNYVTINGKIDTKGITYEGKCWLSAQSVTGFIDYDSIDVYLKKLKAPTNLKVVAGKKRVTISYSKAAGAKKYEIYRSTKKNSGYKKIATTTKTKYIDKTAKKGKRYYYKVRSLRTSYGTVRSVYTTPKKSGKVK